MVTPMASKQVVTLGLGSRVHYCRLFYLRDGLPSPFQGCFHPRARFLPKKGDGDTRITRFGAIFAFVRVFPVFPPPVSGVSAFHTPCFRSFNPVSAPRFRCFRPFHAVGWKHPTKQRPKSSNRGWEHVVTGGNRLEFFFVKE